MKLLTTASLFTLTSTALCTMASAQFTLQPAVSYAAGIEPSGMASADFDNDGDLDLATTADIAGNDWVVVLLNAGDGTYTAGPTTFLGNGISPQDVAAGQFTGDANVDLAIAVRDPNGAVTIMAGNGTGSFSAAGTFATGDRPRGLAVADFDGDLDLDIAVANRDGLSASVLTNTGGSFTVQTMAAGGETRATAFIDFDGDTDLDLAVTDSDNRQIDLFTNAGGSFSFSSSLAVGLPNGVRPDGIVATDLNGDGDMDLAVGANDQTLNINVASVLLANGVGGFNTWVHYAAAGNNPSAIAAADLDCNASADLVTCNSDSNNLSLLANNGSGAFAAGSTFTAGTNPGEITVADLDGDGLADIAVANRDSNSVTVHINATCTPAAQGDANGDGVVDFDDLLAVLSSWGPCAGCAADFDGDDIVGFSDLLEVLSNWS